MLLEQLLSGVTEKLAKINITGVTASSNEVKSGCAFVCIKGLRFDGHSFAETAIKSGAAVVVTERDLGIKNQVVVSDTRAAFAEMSANWFHNPAKKMKLIGVTGTNGKTSTSYMIKSILEKAGYKVGLIGTIQNMIGNEVFDAERTTPDPYAVNELFNKMYENGCQYVVMEVSSHALHQKRVYKLPFAAGLFTNLTQDHLDYHETMEEYAKAKALLFEMCDISVVNIDDDFANTMLSSAKNKKITYSLNNNNADYYTNNIKFKPESVNYNILGKDELGINLKIGGKFSVYNSMLAAVCTLQLGIDKETVFSAINEIQGVKGRAEPVENDFGFSIIIDYAHTPDGLKNILATFKECEKNSLTVLFGCGGDRDKTKRPLMAQVAAEYADKLIITSDNPRSEEPMDIINDILMGVDTTKNDVTVIENRVEAINYAVETAQKGDIVVLAGKGHETYQILKDKTIELDERKVVIQALNKRKGEVK